MKTIYDKDGNSKTVEDVDAREHIETGEWFAVKPEADAPVVEPAVDPVVEPRGHRR